MKLIIQIPCYNEEKTLPLVVNSIPRKIKGVRVVEILVIDDGSSDKTSDVARSLGVDHIIRHKKNKGLAATFEDGINYALSVGANIIVNTDGDNQYPQEAIPRLIKPILNGTHDIVVADRQTDTIQHFSPAKRFLQKFGSNIVCKAAGINVPDAPSGFRAYSKEAAMNLNIITNFSYCMETIIQAGKKRIAITHIPIKTNPKTRESRLFKSVREHVFKSASAIIRSYAMYEPFKIFLISGLFVFSIGTIPYFTFAYSAITRGELISGHLQSLILGAVFMILGFMFVVMGILADLIGINRKLLENNLYRLKHLQYKNQKSKVKHYV